MVTSQVTVTTTATLLVAADPHDQTVLLHCESGSVFVGNAAVTSANGYKLHNQDSITLPLGAYQALYGIVSAGSSTVFVYAEVN